MLLAGKSNLPGHLSWLQIFAKQRGSHQRRAATSFNNRRQSALSAGKLNTRIRVQDYKFSSQLLDQATSFRKDIYSLMKYESLYRLNVLESMDQLAEKQQEYNQAKATLMKKKEKLYS